MGALLGGADDDTVARLRRYGLAFGIAFQHADDVLDDDQPALRQAALARVKASNAADKLGVYQMLSIRDDSGVLGDF